jgi:hypothetical protein
MGAPAAREEWRCYSYTSLQSIRECIRSVSAGTTGGKEAYYLDVFRSALDTQESALQNLKGAETLCEYVLKLLTGAKIREREGFVLLADGSHCFVFVANIKDVRFMNHPVKRERYIHESIFAVI